MSEHESLEAENARLRAQLERERARRRRIQAAAEQGLRAFHGRERELQTLERIATKANQGGDLREVLQFGLEEICRVHDWQVGHGYLVHAEAGGPVARPAGVWFCANETAFMPFRRVTQHSEFVLGEGLPGRAVARAQPVWIADISADQNFPRLGVGWACGLRSAVAFPVMSGSAVVGVLEFFDTQVRAAHQSLLDTMAQIGTQLGRVIERQRAEEALKAQARALVRARDEAEAADRAKSAFLANMSHELRTPLNAIIGFSEIMQHEIAGPLSARYRDYAGDIQRSGIHLKNIINDVLDLSKVAVGALELREAPVCLDGILENCRRIIMPLAEAGEVTFVLSVMPGLPRLTADETRLQQTLFNLLSNAVKFTPPRGRVELSAARREDGDFVLAVTDTGIGMSEQDVALALQPFRQIDNSLSRRYEGTGLGLPLAKAFAELHGGTLMIDSVPYEGTRVELVLPAARALKAVA